MKHNIKVSATYIKKSHHPLSVLIVLKIKCHKTNTSRLMFNTLRSDINWSGSNILQKQRMSITSPNDLMDALILTFVLEPNSKVTQDRFKNNDSP